jgi:hypothetical protein
VDERHVRAAGVAGARNRTTGLSRRAVGQHSYRVDRFGRRAARDHHVAAGERGLVGGARSFENDRLLGRDLRLPLLDPWRDERDTPRFDALDRLTHARMVVHRLVHRGRDDHGDAGPERGRRRGSDRGIVDRAGDLPDGVGGRGREQEDVGPALAAAEFDVLDAPRDLGHHRVVGRELDGPRMDDSLGALGHHASNRGSLTTKLVGEFDGLDRRDRAGDPERDVHSAQHPLGMGRLAI